MEEKLPFPGIMPDFYDAMKADEMEYPGYVTPVDFLIERFRKEGMKVAFGKNLQSGNVYILPSGSDDIESDGIFPRYFQLGDRMPEELKELITVDRLNTNIK